MRKIMRNPFMMLTEVSVEHPKKAFGAIMLAVFLLASGAMHLQFDNSEDGFFPDDPSVDLLNEVEGEYRSNIDFIRVIDEIEENDLLVGDTWTHLAAIEAIHVERYKFPALSFPAVRHSGEQRPSKQRHAMADASRRNYRIRMVGTRSKMPLLRFSAHRDKRTSQQHFPTSPPQPLTYLLLSL